MTINPYSIVVHCDGAMDYDSKQTGGIGFTIDFPEEMDLDSIHKYYRKDKQNIERLELISILESMDHLIKLGKDNDCFKIANSILIFTDRYSIADRTLNPYVVAKWRKNKWENDNGKPIKNKDLIDEIDKKRVKLSQFTRGPVKIIYKRRNENKTADKLSKKGKKSSLKSKKVVKTNTKQITKRYYKGDEVEYTKIKNSSISVRIYSWEPIKDYFEIYAEILDHNFRGKKVKINVNKQTKAKLHRSHCYKLKIKKVLKYYIEIEHVEEIDCNI